MTRPGRPARPSRTHTLGRLALAAAATATAVLTGLGTIPGATASPGLDTARDKAARLHRQLTELQTQAALANERYDAAQAELGQVVTARILAERQLQQASADAAGASAVESSTVRAIYRAGGAAALYATVLEGTDPGDVLSRIEAVRTIVDGDHSATKQATSVVADARQIEARLERLALDKTRLEAGVEQ